MKVTFIIKKAAKRYDTESMATIYVRFRNGRQLDSVAPTQLAINPNLWDDKDECVKTKAVCNEEMRTHINEEIRQLKTYIEKVYQQEKEAIDKEWLKTTLDKFYHPEKYFLPEEVVIKPTIGELFDEFLNKHPLSEVRKKNFRVVKRALLRYELYVRATKRGQKGFILDMDLVTPDTLRDMWDFFQNEYQYYELYPSIYETIPEKRTPQPRSKNTLIDCFSRIRTFFLWSFDIQLAHVAATEATYVVEKIAGKPHSFKLEVVPAGMYVSLPIVPNCIYTQPEIATVGITEETARASGMKVRCGRYSMMENGKSIIAREEEGFIRLIFEAYSDTIVGAQIVCPRATDMIGEMATAIANGLTASQLSMAMRAHPTYSEGISAAIADAMRQK